MSAQAVWLTGQAGHLAAQFAHKMQSRLTHSRPSAAAWETHLAVRRGIDVFLPRLTGSINRLLTEARPKAAGQPISLAVGAAAEARHAKNREEMLPGRGILAPVPPRGLSSLRASAPLRPEVAQEISLRHLPPAALRAKLIRQSGRGEEPAISLRQTLLPHLKFDPAMARLHRGAAAAAAARELDAEAFTIGPDVFFAEGRYAPQTRAGLGLLAHELTHVGQQTALLGDKMRFFTPHGGDALENEAQQIAARVLEADDHEKADRTGGALHQTSAPPRPELAFALSPAQSRGAASAPAQKATEENGQSGGGVDPSQADARAITDRVYEIMKQEIALGRERGGMRRKV